MQPNPMFPISLNLHGKTCLVLGGGQIAFTKAQPLLEAGAAVHIVAPTLIPEFHPLTQMPNAIHISGTLKPEHLKGIILAIDSGEAPACSSTLQKVTREQNIILNSVDKPEHCDFHVPAIVRRGPVQIAISTGGAAPTLARNIRQKLERLLPNGIERLVQAAEAFRSYIKAELDQPKQRAFWNKVFDDSHLATLSNESSEKQTQTLLQIAEEINQGDQKQGAVWLVGAGAGNADMITLRGLKALETADVILHDALIDDDLLAYARRDAKLVAVGKRCGKQSASQEFINRSLANYAQRGLKVVRLKCGDPFIFGRGGEELQHLQNENVEVHIVPGVTAASVAAADTGVSLTHRGLARRITFMTATTNVALPKDRPDWNALLSGGTVALYMARRSGTRTLMEILDAGLSQNLPALMIANAGSTDKKVIYGTVQTLAQKLDQIPLDAPSILLIGETINNHMKTTLPLLTEDSSNDAKAIHYGMSVTRA